MTARDASPLVTQDIDSLASSISTIPKEGLVEDGNGQRWRRMKTGLPWCESRHKSEFGRFDEW
jgi:hypothetical protein